MKLDSKIVHIGVCTDERTGAISTPLYQSATFRHPALGESTGFDLPGHAGKATHDNQSSGHGGMLSFVVDSSQLARQVLRKVKLIRFAEILG
jgi:cystathionine beta-lyase/cystathionine gamma-synthase